MAKASNKTIPATKAPESTKPLAKGGAVAFVNPKALQIDVGAKVLASFAAMKTIDNDMKLMQDQKDAKKRETLNRLTLAFIHAAQNDKNINLMLAISKSNDDQKDIRERLYVAVGIKTETINEDGTKKIDWSKATEEYFPHSGLAKDSDEYKQRENFRSNFAGQFSKAMKSAAGVNRKGVVLSMDKTSGNLLAEGKAVKEAFGVDKVLINEKRTATDSDGTVRKLKAIPSFTELGRMAYEGSGQTLATRADSRAKVAVVGEGEVLQSVKALTASIANLKSFGDELADALEALQDACGDALERREDEASPKTAA
jgi:hypothetical protein